MACCDRCSRAGASEVVNGDDLCRRCADEWLVREEYERLARAQADDEIRRGIPQFQGSAPAVSLVDLRKALLTRRINMLRDRQDAALERLAIQEGVHVRARADQHNLTRADWDAGVRFGGDTRHTVMIEPDQWSTPPPSAPSPTPAAPAPNGGPDSSGGSASGEVRTFADLREPGIDPFDYPDQLPEHLGQVHRLLTARAAELEEEARQLEAQAEALYDYVSYMDGADLVSNVLDRLQEAADTFSGQGGARWEVASQVADAAEVVAEAQRAAEARYGDNNVPRFDRASG